MRVGIRAVLAAGLVACTFGQGQDLSVLLDAKRKALNMRGAAVAYKQPGMAEPYTAGFGKTALSDTSSDVTADTVFLIASISKVFTGTAVMTLVSRGLITLDDDICDTVRGAWSRYPGWETACRHPDHPNTPITWRMLITHRSSLKRSINSVTDEEGDLVDAHLGPEGGYEDGSARGNPTCPLRDTIGFYRDYMIDKDTETAIGRGVRMENGAALRWWDVNEADDSPGSWLPNAPGSKLVYSNLATGYIAPLYEMKTGKTITEDMKATVFSRLAMDNTAWNRVGLPAGVAEAIPCVWNPAAGTWTEVGHYCFIDYTSGGLRTTARDLARFAESMLNFGAPALWSETVGKRAMGCLEKTETGAAPEECEHGACWEILNNDMKDTTGYTWLEPYKKHDWTGGAMHAGEESGAATQLLVLPAAGVYVVVLSNTNGNGDDAAQLLTQEVGVQVNAGKLPTQATPEPETPEPDTPEPEYAYHSDSEDYDYDTEPVDDGEPPRSNAASTPEPTAAAADDDDSNKIGIIILAVLGSALVFVMIALAALIVRSRRQAAEFKDGAEDAEGAGSPSPYRNERI